MPSPGELVEAMAAVLGVPPATVTVHDRNLVMAGLRSKHGRGRGAARVTAADAANLLTAMLGSPQVKASSEAVARFRQTRPLRASPKGYRSVGITQLTALDTAHSFVDALEALFLAAADETCAFPPSVEIAAINPVAAGEIRLAGLPDQNVVAVRYAIPPPWPNGTTPSARQEAAWRAKYGRQGDLQECRRVTGQTIVSIATLLSRDGEPNQ